MKEQQQMTSPFLAPIEEPQDPAVKQAYDQSSQLFGKVLTPIKVFNARMPAGFGQFAAKISELDRQLTLPMETQFLIRQHVSNNNICSFCIDIGRAFAIRASMDRAKFDALEQYRTSPLFTDAERAALDYASELTKTKTVNPETFARMASHYSERQICEIVWLVASEHFYNITNIGLNIHSDMLCKVKSK